MGDIAKFATETVAELDRKLKDVRIPRAKLGPCPVCGREIVREPQGLLLLVAGGPGVRLRHLEVQGGQVSCRWRGRAS